MWKDNLNIRGEDIVSLSNHAEMRSKVYMLLSMFYSERPREGFVKRFKEPDFVNNLKYALSDEDDGMKEGLKIFEMFINSIRDIPEAEIAENLAVDFTRLFRGIKRGYGPPPPYESVYRGEGRVMGEWTQAVLKKYSESGIGMDLSDELPDYIGIELKFMALLCYKEAEALRNKNSVMALRFLRLEQMFMDEHLKNWVPEFCDVMAQEATSSFYKSVAFLTKGFLEIESDQFLIEKSDEV